MNVIVYSPHAALKTNTTTSKSTVGNQEEKFDS